MKENRNRTKIIFRVALIVFLAIAIVWIFIEQINKNSGSPNDNNKEVSTIEKQNKEDTQDQKLNWVAPRETTIPTGESGNEIRYGREIIAHTALYLGPKGKVATISNGMNCQNCHNQAGTKSFGFNFSAVAATYPQFRKRSESWVSIAERINSCFNRSLNGQSLDTTSKEMKAMIAYMKWLGKDVPNNLKPVNAGVVKLAYLDRAANPVKGKIVYATCQVCHGQDGQGHLNDTGTEYIFPPLWGKHSYNDGAGLYRLGNFASFVKGNMPFGTTYKHPVLTDEEAWDVAAYVNSQPRPHKNQSKDYSIIADKPIDFPFGPYADNFSEIQHKFGPFEPILSAKKSIIEK
ncbi:MAG: c-type cytochrome [Bacteroidota bacterium]|nr:c-type cytochrome [Bacteroidota bacterium]